MDCVWSVSCSIAELSSQAPSDTGNQPRQAAQKCTEQITDALFYSINTLILYTIELQTQHDNIPYHNTSKGSANILRFLPQ